MSEQKGALQRGSLGGRSSKADLIFYRRTFNPVNEIIVLLSLCPKFSVMRCSLVADAEDSSKPWLMTYGEFSLH